MTHYAPVVTALDLTTDTHTTNSKRTSPFVVPVCHDVLCALPCILNTLPAAAHRCSQCLSTFARGSAANAFVSTWQYLHYCYLSSPKLRSDVFLISTIKHNGVSCFIWEVEWTQSYYSLCLLSMFLMSFLRRINVSVRRRWFWRFQDNLRSGQGPWCQSKTQWP